MLPTRAELVTLLSYDPNTGKLYWKPRPVTMFKDQRSCSTWNSRYANKEAFTAVDHKGYYVGSIYRVNYRASRVIFKILYDINALQVDHEDGNRQNNRPHNLRNVSGPDNQRNMKKPKTNKSGVIGVSWNKEKNSWDARINVNGKNKHLGRFKNFDDAVNCRKQAELQYNYHPNHGRK